MLKQFGLNDLESSVYTTLLQNGPSSAKKVSRKLDLPLPKTYNILNNLQQLGILTKSNSRPSLYSPNNPKNVISILLERKHEEVKTLEREALVIEQKLNSLSNTRTLNSNFFNFNIGENIRNKNLEIIRNAEKQLEIFIELRERHLKEDKDQLIDFLDFINKKASEEVIVRIIIGLDNDYLLHEFKDILVNKSILSSSIEIRITDEINTIFYIIDKKKVLVKIVDPVTGDYDFTSIFIWEENFAQQFINKFDILWMNSTNIATIELSQNI